MTQPYGPIPCGCPTWKSVSLARSAATAAPMSGRCLSPHAWAQTPRFRVRRSFTADNIP